jgi:hypothetical protein
MSAHATKFSLGHLVATPNALVQIPSDEIQLALSRHIRGDWGTLDDEDLQSNERALQKGGRLFSQYYSNAGTKFWIITECDRSATTVLLPEDY